MNRYMLVSALVLWLAVLGCGDDSDGGELGTYTFTLYGEAFIEEGIPANEVVDGWTITFDRFLIAVDEVRAGDVAMDGAVVLDLTTSSAGQGHRIAEVEASVGRYTDLTYRVGPVTQAQAGPGATADDVATMTGMGYAMLVEGSATRGTESKTFTWAFATETTYLNCQTQADVEVNSEGVSQLTIHADHLFYDDLVSEEPNVAFDLVASADANGDGEVTQAELAQVDLSTQSRYQVGSAPIQDLWGFIEAQTRTLGHIDGEGHCDTQ